MGCNRIQLAANALSGGNGVVWVGRFDDLKQDIPSYHRCKLTQPDYFQTAFKNYNLKG
jgi:hypothetical protein